MRFRRPLKVTSRTSTVTNAFVQAILPWQEPTERQRIEACAILGVDHERPTCSYCGNPATDWDHLKPLVQGKRPSGYVSDYRNLVPSCAPCNQSKSGSHWLTWMRGTATGSPARRDITDIDARIERLRAFETWAGAEPLDFQSIVGPELWAQYWEQLGRVETALLEAQRTAMKINEIMAAKMKAE